MTGEYGAPSQLEKIDMLDYADLVAINKFCRCGNAANSLRSEIAAQQIRCVQLSERPCRSSRAGETSSVRQWKRRKTSSIFTVIPVAGSVTSPAVWTVGFLPGSSTTIDSSEGCTIQQDWMPASR